MGNYLARADTLEVDIIATEASMDGFIDDIITITVDADQMIELEKSAAILIIHTLF